MSNGPFDFGCLEPHNDGLYDAGSPDYMINTFDGLFGVVSSTFNQSMDASSFTPELSPVPDIDEESNAFQKCLDILGTVDEPDVREQEITTDEYVPVAMPRMSTPDIFGADSDAGSDAGSDANADAAMADGSASDLDDELMQFSLNGQKYKIPTRKTTNKRKRNEPSKSGKVRKAIKLTGIVAEAEEEGIFTAPGKEWRHPGGDLRIFLQTAALLMLGREGRPNEVFEAMLDILYLQHRMWAKGLIPATDYMISPKKSEASRLMLKQIQNGDTVTRGMTYSLFTPSDDVMYAPNPEVLDLLRSGYYIGSEEPECAFLAALLGGFLGVQTGDPVVIALRTAMFSHMGREDLCQSGVQPAPVPAAAPVVVVEVVEVVEATETETAVEPPMVEAPVWATKSVFCGGNPLEMVGQIGPMSGSFIDDMLDY
jgi:hypothetical protein